MQTTTQKSPIHAESGMSYFDWDMMLEIARFVLMKWGRIRGKKTFKNHKEKKHWEFTKTPSVFKLLSKISYPWASSRGFQLSQFYNPTKFDIPPLLRHIQNFSIT